MPTYVYKAMTDKGLIIRNKVEAGNKNQLVKTLKNNNLLPISIDQVAYRSNRQNVKKKKKNVSDIQEIMKNVNTTQIGPKRTLSTKEKVNLYFAKTEKITDRDIVIFTQNFYLLKKANFNNIHALSTIISSASRLPWKANTQAAGPFPLCGPFPYRSDHFRDRR